MPKVIELTEDERYGLLEAVDRGLDDATDYQQNGNPRTDYGEEWPETAIERARRWRDCASALRKILGEPCAMAESCETLANALEASAAEYVEQEASRG